MKNIFAHILESNKSTEEKSSMLSLVFWITKHYELVEKDYPVKQESKNVVISPGRMRAAGKSSDPEAGLDGYMQKNARRLANAKAIEIHSTESIDEIEHMSDFDLVNEKPILQVKGFVDSRHDELKAKHDFIASGQSYIATQQEMVSKEVQDKVDFEISEAERLRENALNKRLEEISNVFTTRKERAEVNQIRELLAKSQKATEALNKGQDVFIRSHETSGFIEPLNEAERIKDEIAKLRSLTSKPSAVDDNLSVSDSDDFDEDSGSSAEYEELKEKASKVDELKVELQEAVKYRNEESALYLKKIQKLKEELDAYHKRDETQVADKVQEHLAQFFNQKRQEEIKNRVRRDIEYKKLLVDGKVDRIIETDEEINERLSDANVALVDKMYEEQDKQNSAFFALMEKVDEVPPQVEQLASKASGRASDSLDKIVSKEKIATEKMLKGEGGFTRDSAPANHEIAQNLEAIANKVDELIVSKNVCVNPKEHFKKFMPVTEVSKERVKHLREHPFEEITLEHDPFGHLSEEALKEIEASEHMGRGTEKVTSLKEAPSEQEPEDYEHYPLAQQILVKFEEHCLAHLGRKFIPPYFHTDMEKLFVLAIQSEMAEFLQELWLQDEKEFDRNMFYLSYKEPEFYLFIINFVPKYRSSGAPKSVQSNEELEAMFLHAKLSKEKSEAAVKHGQGGLFHRHAVDEKEEQFLVTPVTGISDYNAMRAVRVVSGKSRVVSSGKILVTIKPSLLKDLLSFVVVSKKLEDKDLEELEKELTSFPKA